MTRRELRGLVDTLDDALAEDSIDWVATSDVWLSLRLETMGTAFEDSVTAAGDCIAIYEPQVARDILRAVIRRLGPDAGRSSETS